MIRMYLLTAMRRDEIYKASIIDDSEGQWIFIPDTKNGKDFFIPIADSMRPYLYLFDEGDKLPQNIRKTLMGLSGAIGKEPYVSIHDLRRTTSTLMASLGVDGTIISRCLNHTLTGVTERHYIQRDRGDTLQAFETVGQWLNS